MDWFEYQRCNSRDPSFQWESQQNYKHFLQRWCSNLWFFIYFFMNKNKIQKKLKNNKFLLFFWVIVCIRLTSWLSRNSEFIFQVDDGKKEEEKERGEREKCPKIIIFRRRNHWNFWSWFVGLLLELKKFKNKKLILVIVSCYYFILFYLFADALMFIIFFFC